MHHNFVSNALLAKNLFSMFSMVVKIKNSNYEPLRRLKILMIDMIVSNQLYVLITLGKLLHYT